MPPILTVFATSPDKGQGLARDMRVRWALEEVGLPYDVRLVTFAEMKRPPHLARHPFGQIPTYEDGAVTLFESGAIVLHIAGQHPGLLPDDPAARARAIGWMFAALSTVEPVYLERESAFFTERDKPYYPERITAVEGRIRHRLAQLSNRLGEADWLDGDFSAGDLMMVGVLFRMKPVGLLTGFDSLAAYVARAEARPAFQRAFAGQLAVFTGQQSGV